MKKIISIILTALMLVSAFAVIPTFANDGGAAQIPDGVSDGIAGVTNLQQVAHTDFTQIQSTNQLNTAGWKLVGSTDETIPTLSYPDGGVKLNTDANAHLVYGGHKFNGTDNYIIDFTFTYNKNVWIQVFGLGYTSADNAPSSTEWTTIDGNTCLKMRGSTVIDSWKYYSDENYFHMIGNGESGMDEDGVAALNEGNVDVRIRMVVSGGTGRYAYISFGDDFKYYVVRNSEFRSIVDTYFGFTHVGSKGESRGIVIKDFAAYTFTQADVIGGTEVKAEKTKDYQDKNETYYKDGYVLHYMDFAQVETFADTGYSFTVDSPTDRVVDVRDDKLYIANKSDAGAYMLFTGNAIPQAITEYTVTYNFRFLDGGDKPYLSFVRGLTLDANGLRDRSRDVDVFQRNVTKPSYVQDCEADDAAKWETIAAAIMAGEEVSIAISSISRKIDKIMIAYGDTVVTFKMDSADNKVAYDGYMGLKLSPKSAVEVSEIMVVAGAYDYVEKAGITFPTGIEAGKLVQNVTAEAVATGTKPTYADPAAKPSTGDSGNSGDKNPANTTEAPKTTEAPAADTEATEAEKKKGCKSSVAIALPALVVTTVFGCAVCTKKKED